MSEKPSTIILRGHHLFFVYDEEEVGVKQARIIANGICDLALVRSNGEVHIKKREEIDETQSNVYVPKGDILYLEFEKPFQKQRVVYLDIESDSTGNMKKAVRKIIERGLISIVGKNYEMYGGNTYW